MSGVQKEVTLGWNDDTRYAQHDQAQASIDDGREQAFRGLWTETRWIGAAFRDSPHSSSIAAITLRFLRLPSKTDQDHLGWLARQPMRTPQRVEHRKLIVLR